MHAWRLSNAKKKCGAEFPPAGTRHNKAFHGTTQGRDEHVWMQVRGMLGHRGTNNNPNPNPLLSFPSQESSHTEATGQSQLLQAEGTAF
jgi:hypothetical protein